MDRHIIAAQGASKRATALTHRLLAFSRRQTLDPKPTDVVWLIKGMADLIRRTVGPEITIETMDMAGLWTTLVDPNQPRPRCSTSPSTLATPCRAVVG